MLINNEDLIFHPNFDCSVYKRTLGRFRVMTIPESSLKAIKKTLFREYSGFIEIGEYCSKTMDESKFNQLFDEFIEPLMDRVQALEFEKSQRTKSIAYEKG